MVDFIRMNVKNVPNVPVTLLQNHPSLDLSEDRNIDMDVPVLSVRSSANMAASWSMKTQSLMSTNV